MKRICCGRVWWLVVVLLAVVVLGSIDGGVYLRSRSPGKSHPILPLAARSTLHPLVGLALPVLATISDGLAGGLRGLLAVVPVVLVVFAARRFLSGGRWGPLLCVVLAGFSSYWISTRLLFGVLYGPAMY
jgi:hypothetical protein